MDTQSIQSLISQCEQELCIREFTLNRHRLISGYWNELALWMGKIGVEHLAPEIGQRYCIETFGSDILSGIDRRDQLRLRAVRMLMSYQRDGDFEFRTPSVSRPFYGQIGKHMESYLEHLRDDGLSKDTIANNRLYLQAFNCFLEKHGIMLEVIDANMISDFYAGRSYTLASKHNCNSALRTFLRYAFDTGVTAKDMSINVMPDNYRKHSKIPTTYEENEIRKLLASIERASAIGKRNYLILLLASEYGWRSSDIVNFRFDQIDWDKSIITICQKKTGVFATFPLLSSIGNAIIDYLKNGRPETEAQEIIVSGESAKRGKKLSEPTIHSVVAKYMRIAQISNWQQKKHGPHSLRHSLATNMLKKNVSMPIISTVLGHQSTETTKIYLSLDIEQLRKCALPIPVLKTDVFEVVL